MLHNALAFQLKVRGLKPSRFRRAAPPSSVWVMGDVATLPLLMGDVGNFVNLILKERVSVL